jgi:hypothetical protein
MRFSTLGFFVNRLPLGPQLTPQNIFDFCFEFAEKYTKLCLAKAM